MLCEGGEFGICKVFISSRSAIRGIRMSQLNGNGYLLAGAERVMDLAALTTISVEF